MTGLEAHVLNAMPMVSVPSVLSPPPWQSTRHVSRKSDKATLPDQRNHCHTKTSSSSIGLTFVDERVFAAADNGVGDASSALWPGEADTTSRDTLPDGVAQPVSGTGLGAGI